MDTYEGTTGYERNAELALRLAHRAAPPRGRITPRSAQSDDELDDSSGLGRVSHIMRTDLRTKIEKMHRGTTSWDDVFAAVPELQGILAGHETPKDVMTEFYRRERWLLQYGSSQGSGYSGWVKPNTQESMSTSAGRGSRPRLQTDGFHSQMISTQGPAAAAGLNHPADKLAHDTISISETPSDDEPKNAIDFMERLMQDEKVRKAFEARCRKSTIGKAIEDTPEIAESRFKVTNNTWLVVRQREKAADERKKIYAKYGGGGAGSTITSATRPKGPGIGLTYHSSAAETHGLASGFDGQAALGASLSGFDWGQGSPAADGQMMSQPLSIQNARSAPSAHLMPPMDYSLQRPRSTSPTPRHVHGVSKVTKPSTHHRSRSAGPIRHGQDILDLAGWNPGLLDADHSQSMEISQVSPAFVQQGLQNPSGLSTYFPDQSTQYQISDLHQGQLGRSLIQSNMWPADFYQAQPVFSHLTPQPHELMDLTSMSPTDPLQDGTSSQAIPWGAAVCERPTAAPQTRQHFLGDDSLPAYPPTVSVLQPDYSPVTFGPQRDQSDLGSFFTQPTYAGQIQNIDPSRVPLQGGYMDGTQTAFIGGQCTCGGGRQCADCLEFSRLLAMAENEALTSGSGVEGVFPESS